MCFYIAMLQALDEFRMVNWNRVKHELGLLSFTSAEVLAN